MCLNAQQPKIHSKSKYNDAEVILEASLTLPCKTSYQSWFWTLMCTFSCICTNIQLQETLPEHDDSGLKWFYVIHCTVWLCIQCFIHNFPTRLPQYVSSHSIFVFIVLACLIIKVIVWGAMQIWVAWPLWYPGLAACQGPCLNSCFTAWVYVDVHGLCCHQRPYECPGSGSKPVALLVSESNAVIGAILIWMSWDATGTSITSEPNCCQGLCLCPWSCCSWSLCWWL